MPKITDITPKAPFKKKEYRPYGNIESQLNSEVDTPFKELSNNDSNIGKIIDIEPNLIKIWENKDRPENELGDIDAFSKELLETGQKIPCIVRQNGETYELIAGERRWRAALKANIKLKVLVQDLNDKEAAICQIAENSNRRDLSDYAKGMSYTRLIGKNLIKQNDLITKLGMSKQQISRLLSFKDIPFDLIEAIGDMTKVSSRTAEEIRLICNKDPNNISFLKIIADKISSGIGANTLQKEFKRASENNIQSFTADKILSKSGRHLFTWRKDGNGNRSISFPKDISTNIDHKKIEEILSKSIEMQLEELK